MYTHLNIYVYIYIVIYVSIYLSIPPPLSLSIYMNICIYV